MKRKIDVGIETGLNTNDFLIRHAFIQVVDVYDYVHEFFSQHLYDINRCIFKSFLESRF